MIHHRKGIQVIRKPELREPILPYKAGSSVAPHHITLVVGVPSWLPARSVKHYAFLWLLVSFIFLPFLIEGAGAHDVSQSDRELIGQEPGLQFLLYTWLGAKHMVTGYDHLLFLVGVIFYLRRIREIAVFTGLFALGHTITLLTGVLVGLQVNPFIVDAIIGLSVVYKGFDNLGGFQQLFGETPDERLAVLIFGLFHGLGLATKLQDLGLQRDGLLGNLIAFNVGVELGQFAALLIIVLLLRSLAWAPHNTLVRNCVNGSLMVAGFALVFYQLAQLWAS